MKEMFEEYGSTAAAVLTGVLILGLLIGICIPNSPVQKVVSKFLTATMPFQYKD